MQRSSRWLVGLALVASAAAAAPITLASLLTEMVDRDALARFPEPAYTCRQFSSYDRASKSPTENWFANNDFNQFLRTETNGGRKEWVLMDAAGPGAIVRIWSANPPGACTMRFYLDGAEEPAWAVDFQKLTNGDGPVKAPLSAVRSRGWNCYLPIPYARHCKVTTDKAGYYYQINYRTYPAAAAVTSFAPAALEAAREQLEGVQKTLSSPPSQLGAESAATASRLKPKAQLILNLPTGPQAVRELRLKVAAEQLDVALRSTILSATFDGEECIWCPLGDFFGSGIGANPYQDWYRTVSADGTLVCRWVMPYEQTGKLTITNLGEQEVTITPDMRCGPWTWDARAMHFRCNWRDQYPIATATKADWNYLEATGRGVYVGDTLAVFNPVTAWWGEGDEKVYVDGEKFPSHFGTGTEDYYGYAWCSNVKFTAPFHAQPRCDGPGNKGHTTNTRVRSLDAIPFTSALRFDMEVWHWARCEVSYAASTYWYGAPGAQHNRAPQPDAAVRPLPVAPQPKAIAGAVEGEGLTVLAKAEGLPVEAQDMGGFGDAWSGGRQLFVRGRKVGDFVELKVPVTGAEPRKLILHLTKSYDYGILKVTVNGQDAGAPIDTWADKVTASGPIELGPFTPVDGMLRLKLEVVGRHAQSRGSGAYFGLDAVVVR